MTEQSKSTQEPGTLVAHYLGEIEKKTIPGVAYVYRGQANACWLLESGAERRVKLAIKTATPSVASKQNETPPIISALKKDDGSLPHGSMEEYHNNLLTTARHKGFGLLDGRHLSDLELLTELQHFGAATCLLDFTENALVALYFSCRSNDGKDGEIFCVPHRNISTAPKDSKISELLQNRKLYQWRPMMHGAAERRIIRQDGLFLINSLSNLDDWQKIAIPIRAADKEKMREELKDAYQISEETLFIDLSGFAKNQASGEVLEDYWVYFYFGNTKFDLEKYEAAIENYDKAIGFKPDFAEAYNNRGYVKDSLEQYEDAIRDYTVAIRLKPDYAAAYNNRGVTNSRLEQYEVAIADYDKAIGLKPYYAVAYNNRGNAKFFLGEYEVAIEDYNKAIRLQPDYAMAYYHRGVAWIKLGNRKQARADLWKALRLAEEQNLSVLESSVRKALDILNASDD